MPNHQEQLPWERSIASPPSATSSSDGTGLRSTHDYGEERHGTELREPSNRRLSIRHIADQTMLMAVEGCLGAKPTVAMV
jgi:hypothetical protein